MAPWGPEFAYNQGPYSQTELSLTMGSGVLKIVDMSCECVAGCRCLSCEVDAGSRQRTAGLPPNCEQERSSAQALARRGGCGMASKKMRGKFTASTNFDSNFHLVWIADVKAFSVQKFQPPRGFKLYLTSKILSQKKQLKSSHLHHAAKRFKESKEVRLSRELGLSEVWKKLPAGGVHISHDSNQCKFRCLSNVDVGSGMCRDVPRPQRRAGRRRGIRKCKCGKQADGILPFLSEKLDLAAQAWRLYQAVSATDDCCQPLSPKAASKKGEALKLLHIHFSSYVSAVGEYQNDCWFKVDDSVGKGLGLRSKAGLTTLDYLIPRCGAIHFIRRVAEGTWLNF
ncbi:hypothetical protein C8R45DRAFT_1077579 [Mycena sanguinolenta]|nr:hypothetical protein C8R45DRAFT_1077579 [Mycena sanguinolenta]